MENIVVKNLHPLEVKVLLAYNENAELSVEAVEHDLAFKPGNGNQALSWLAAKHLVSESRRQSTVYYELTPLGRNWRSNGSPEERLIEALRIAPATLPELARRLSLDAATVGSAFGTLQRLGVLALDGDKKATIALPADMLCAGRPANGKGAEHLALERGLLNRAGGGAPHNALPQQSDNTPTTLLAATDLSSAEQALMKTLARKRSTDAPFRVVERETVYFRFTENYAPVVAALRAAGISGDEVGPLTPEMLANGTWKSKSFRAYNVHVPPARLLAGRTNAYAQFLDDTKDKLVSLGFEEFDGPLVETEFWNCDALFMPQFHAARDIHDVYHIAEPSQAKRIDEPWLSAVAATHENGGATGSRGWSYQFDRDFTRRLILRSQGTVLSAKTLPHAKIPGKYFGMLRCFRYDKVDATHLSDFYQTEGIVLGEDVNLKTLLGMLEMFAVEVAGAKEVKYVPGYFPFTEPSVEVHIKHPKLGWFELGGSGIFRPEVTASMGVSVPVAAWGIGIDRMALMALGLSDLRELFSYDIEAVRLRRA
jgi:phenylalanyl-tRNA synthetase alpha chain